MIDSGSQSLRAEANRLCDQGCALEAIALLKQAIELDPEAMRNWVQLALYLKRAGDREQALVHARRASELAEHPRYDEYKESRSVTFRFLGSTLYEYGQYEEALVPLQKALDHDCDGGAFVLLQSSLEELGRIDEAREVLSQGVEAFPDNAQIAYSLAMYSIEKDPDRALALLQHTVEIAPTNAAAWRSLGRGFYCHRDQCERAAECFARALALDENDKLAHHYYAYVLADLKEYEQAEAHWRKAAELDAKWAAPYCELGILYQNTDRLEEADIAHRRAVEIDPHDLESVHQLGWFLLDVGRPEEASVYLAKALEMHPKPEKAQRIARLLKLAEDWLPDEDIET